MNILFNRDVSAHVQEACEILTQRMLDNNILNVWHNSRGKSDMAVGKTWEHVNGIPANSRQGPDEFVTARGKRVGFEHKAALIETASLGTLFCKEADGRGSNRLAVETYHQWSDDEERHGLYATIAVGRETSIDGHVFQLVAENNSLLLSVDNNPFLEWTEKNLTNAAKKKLDHVMVRVKAEERIQDGKRQFRFNNLGFHTEFAFGNLMQAFSDGHAAIDFRCHFTGEKLRNGRGEIRNHGTAIRMTDSRIPSLFGVSASVA
jgi:hypothetical protein